MMSVKLKPLYRVTKEATAWARLMRRVGKYPSPVFLMRAPLRHSVYHHGERSSDSARAFNKLSISSNCLAEQQGSESQNPLKKIVFNSSTLWSTQPCCSPSATYRLCTSVIHAGGPVFSVSHWG